MSLDVALFGEEQEIDCMCPHCTNVHKRITQETFYDANITHNLGTMADKAGIYKHLWRPEEIGITKASQLIEPLREGLALLKSKPEYFEQFNASNGWGLYIHFVPFVENYLNACIEHPNANVWVGR